MDGATNTSDTTSRLIALDITDAAYRLWAELHEAALFSSSSNPWGDGDYSAPSLERAWETYVERGAHNYAWWDAEGAFNAAGWTAFNRFADAFEDGPGIYGMLHAG